MVCFGEGGQTDRQTGRGRDGETEPVTEREKRWREASAAKNKRGNTTAAAPERRRHRRQLVCLKTQSRGNIYTRAQTHKEAGVAEGFVAGALFHSAPIILQRFDWAAVLHLHQHY